MKEFMNEKPIRHTARNGTLFKADRGDLVGCVVVDSHYPTTKKNVMADFFEFGAWHSVNIWPNLNGFNGYDCVKFIFKISFEEDEHA